MSNNKLNCDSEIKSLKDQVDKQKRQISIFNNVKSLTEQNAEDTNKLISKANASVLCGPGSDCYRNQEIDKLKKIYTDKQYNKKTAPEQLDDARKNYYVYAFGQPGYVKKETEILTKRVDEIIVQKTNVHKMSIQEINLFISSYDSAVSYKANLLLYLAKLYKENEVLSQEIIDSIADLKTSDRKVWYEDEQIKTIDMWVTILTGLYWMVFAIFAGLFLWNKMWNIDKPFKYVYCVVLLLLAAWIYVGDYLVIKLLQLIQKLLTYLPKNVFFNAKKM